MAIYLGRYTGCLVMCARVLMKNSCVCCDGKSMVSLDSFLLHWVHRLLVILLRNFPTVVS